MSEMLMTFDENAKPLHPKERSLVHKDGDWHKTFHCWFYEQTDNGMVLYLQKRADDKSEFPSLFDITSAGHIEAGEEVMEAGQRETLEEIGVKVDSAAFEDLGFYKEALITDEIKDREICRVFLYEADEKMTFQPGVEVTDLVKVSARDFLDLILERKQRVPSVSLINQSGLMLSKKDLVPHETGYFEFIINGLEKVEKL